MAEKANMKKRLTNPNKEFDSLFWRPKSKFMRRLVARYVDYITFLGYALIILLVGGIIFTWTVDYRIWDDARGEVNLRPVEDTVRTPTSGTILEVLTIDGARVSRGQMLAQISTEGGGAVTVEATAAGIAYAGNGKKGGDVVSGATVAAGEVLFRIVDFSSFAVDLKFEAAKEMDSIGLDDSVSVELIRNSGMDKPTKVTGGLLLSQQGAESRGGAVTCTLPQEIVDSLVLNMRGSSVTAKKSGRYVFDEISEMKLQVEARVSQGQGEPSIHVSAAELGGRIVSGHRWIEVEKISGYPLAARRAVEAWVAENLHGAVVGFEGEKLRIEDHTSIRVETKLKAKVAFSGFVPFRDRGKEIPEDLKKKEWVTAEARLGGIPIHVQKQARMLYEQAPSQYLVGLARVNSYKTSWGRRLIQN